MLGILRARSAEGPRRSCPPPAPGTSSRSPSRCAAPGSRSRSWSIQASEGEPVAGAPAVGLPDRPGSVDQRREARRAGERPRRATREGRQFVGRGARRRPRRSSLKWPGPDDGAHHGIIGMRERVAAFGGAFETGPRAGGGFAFWPACRSEGNPPDDEPRPCRRRPGPCAGAFTVLVNSAEISSSSVRPPTGPKQSAWPRTTAGCGADGLRMPEMDGVEATRRIVAAAEGGTTRLSLCGSSSR